MRIDHIHAVGFSLHRSRAIFPAGGDVVAVFTIAKEQTETIKLKTPEVDEAAQTSTTLRLSC